MTEASTSAAGWMVKRMDMVCVLVRSPKESIQDHGTMDSSFPASTDGPQGRRTKDSGRTERDMESVSSTVASGCTEVSGHKDTRVGMASAPPSCRLPSTKALGPTGSRTDMDLSPMLTEERTKDNGCVA